MEHKAKGFRSARPICAEKINRVCVCLLLWRNKKILLRSFVDTR